MPIRPKEEDWSGETPPAPEAEAAADEAPVGGAEKRGSGKGRAAPRRAPTRSRKTTDGAGDAPAPSTGDGVDTAFVQQTLGVTEDGILGPVTEKALRRWQKARGYSPTGVLTPRQLTRMRAETEA